MQYDARLQTVFRYSGHQEEQVANRMPVYRQSVIRNGCLQDVSLQTVFGDVFIRKNMQPIGCQLTDLHVIIASGTRQPVRCQIKSSMRLVPEKNQLAYRMPSYRTPSGCFPRKTIFSYKMQADLANQLTDLLLVSSEVVVLLVSEKV